MAVYPTLRRGSTGEYVKMVQRKLGVKVDGIFGSVTESAVKTFQRNKHLTVDGIVGKATWTALGYPQTGGGGGGDATNPNGNNQQVGSDVGGSAAAINTTVLNPLNTIIGGVLLFGFYRLLMKIF